ALDADGREAALLSFAPWGGGGLSLDLMRRDRASDNGLMEFMVAEVVAAAPRLGVERISLNFAVFRAVFEEGSRIGAGPVLRGWRRLGRGGSAGGGGRPPSARRSSWSRPCRSRPGSGWRS